MNNDPNWQSPADVPTISEEGMTTIGDIHCVWQCGEDWAVYEDCGVLEKVALMDTEEAAIERARELEYAAYVGWKER